MFKGTRAYGISDSNCYVVNSDHVSLEHKQILALSKEENEKVTVWKLKGA